MLVFSLWLLFRIVAGQEEFFPDPCQHPVYCLGGPNSILEVMNFAKVYPDSKSFVDKPLKVEPEVVVQKFRELMDETRNEPTKEQLLEFLGQYFDDLGAELTQWDPEDWKPEPKFINKIRNDSLRDFGRDLHSRWKDLGRKVQENVKDYPQRNTEIYLPNPFIVPGGRFREMYYWDSYWTMQGLLVSEMPETVKGMLENFVELVETYGHIPNGNRIYYINRSQPPLFISMVKLYYDYSKDKNFIMNNIETLQKEFEFWTRNRTVEVMSGGRKYRMFRYKVNVGTPRPESYLEDFHEARHFKSEGEKMTFYMNMRSGAESGWDYSSKWFIKDMSNVGTLADTKTSDIVPVELNAYLCRNSRILADFYKELGDSENELKYRSMYSEIQRAVEEVLWNERRGVWLDYDLVNKKPRDYFYPTNTAPLWAECYSDSKVRSKTRKIVSYLKNSPALKYPGGVPTSLLRSGQQWDLSNAWPPLQEILITGLENTGESEAQKLAFELTKRWINNNWLTYLHSQKVMFEKFDAEKVGVPGRGGEYEVVKGFGWTNGVLLHLLDKYGNRIPNLEMTTTSGSTPRSTLNFRHFIILCVILAGFN